MSADAHGHHDRVQTCEIARCGHRASVAVSYPEYPRSDDKTLCESHAEFAVEEAGAVRREEMDE